MSNLETSARDRGHKTYEAYFGRRRSEPSNDLDEMTLGHLFANVWSRPRLSMESRSLVTIALLASQGRDDELKSHIAGARHQGCSKMDIEELMIHVAHYAGWAAGHHGLGVLNETWPD